MALRRVVLFCFVFMLLVHTSYACSCIGFGPACTEAVSPHVSAVFLGTVTSIGPSKLPTWLGIHTEDDELLRSMLDVTLSVQEAYKGISTKAVVVRTASNEAACGFPFKQGEQYVVYAYEHEGKLYTSICNRTLPLNAVEKDLDYLRKFKDAPPTGSIFGNYKRYTFDPNFKPKFTPSLMDHYRPPEEYYEAMAPMTGETVTVTGANGERKTASIDSNGRFSFPDLTPGKYKIEVTAPAGMSHPHGYASGMESPFALDELEILPKGCAQVTFRTEPDGHIAGRIVNQDGAPLPHVTVIFWKASEKFNVNASTYTQNNDDGTFDLGPLPPGEYKLAAHVWLLPQGLPAQWEDGQRLTKSTLRFFSGATSPETAKPIKLGFGEHVSSLQIQIPFDPAQWKDVKGSH